MEKYIDFKEKIDNEKLEQIANNLREGKIVVFPTETVYGIGTNGLNQKAVEKLYQIKKRPKENPVSLLVSDIQMVETLAKDITEIEYKIMKTFFPGPLTIILKKKEIVPNIVTANSKFVGIRMPEGEIALKLVKAAEVPIAAPSANISGTPSGTNVEKAMKDFQNSVDIFIDGGESKIGKASTIVKVEKGKPIILREGIITKEQIEKSIK